MKMLSYFYILHKVNSKSMKLFFLFSALWCTNTSVFFKKFQFAVILEPFCIGLLKTRKRTLLGLTLLDLLKEVSKDIEIIIHAALFQELFYQKTILSFYIYLAS